MQRRHWRCMPLSTKLQQALPESKLSASSLALPERPSQRGRRGSAGQTRQQIVLALADLLEEFAIWEISITMLTRKVGVTSQLFYRHFQSLDDTLTALAEDIVDDLPDIGPFLRGDWPDEEGFARLRQVGAANLAYWDRHRTPLRVLGMLDDSRKPRFAQFREMRGQAMAHAFTELVRCRKAGGHLARSIPDDLLAWELTSRLQLFGLHQPQIVARGYRSEAALDAHAAMLAVSLGFPVPNPESAENDSLLPAAMEYLAGFADYR